MSKREYTTKSIWQNNYIIAAAVIGLVAITTAALWHLTTNVCRVVVTPTPDFINMILVCPWELKPGFEPLIRESNVESIVPWLSLVAIAVIAINMVPRAWGWIQRRLSHQ